MVNPNIQKRVHQVIRRSGVHPGRILEVGGSVEGGSLLNAPNLRHAERWCINLVEQPEGMGITPVVGTSNDMHMFANGYFDVVVSNAVHEHDQKFWLSIAEMHRVLRPGGLLVVCVPGFIRSETDRGAATDTYRVRYRFDYYRFSKRAVREVFFDGMESVRVFPLLSPPRIMGRGIKPQAHGVARVGFEARQRRDDFAPWARCLHACGVAFSARCPHAVAEPPKDPPSFFTFYRFLTPRLPSTTSTPGSAPPGCRCGTAASP